VFEFPGAEMTELTAMQKLIVHLAHGGKESSELRHAVFEAYPAATEGEYLSDLLALQNGKVLDGGEDNGAWIYTSVAPEDIVELEYSPAFAEKIIAADCGEWTEIDPDELIADLEAMIKKANDRRASKG
jgi:hypothetical protein